MISPSITLAASLTVQAMFPGLVPDVPYRTMPWGQFCVRAEQIEAFVSRFDEVVVGENQGYTLTVSEKNQTYTLFLEGPLLHEGEEVLAACVVEHDDTLDPVPLIPRGISN